MANISAKRRERAEDVLAATRVAQCDFWKILSDLESCLGMELDSTIDFRDATVDTLLEAQN